MFKYICRFLFIFLLISSSLIYADEQFSAVSPEEYEKELLSNSDGMDEKQLHEKLISAAEIRQATGDLSGAAELFKKASLTIHGKKDFTSLYRAAVLNVEMAYYRAAEADLRAIILFCEDPDLRIKASLLTARMKSLQDSVEEAQSILLSILKSAEKLPEEAGIWASDFYNKNKDLIDMNELRVILENNKEKIFSAAATLKPLITPELIFGSGNIEDDITTVESQPKQSELPATGAAIQLGSFSKKENAEDLVKAIGNIGYSAVIKTKTINEKIYFAVTVPTTGDQNIQNLIIELKEKGYEGYPVY